MTRWEALAGELLGTYTPWIAEVPRTALTVLWLAMHRHEIDSMVALGLVEAAGLSGRQNWSLILSSSARVSRVTYEAVIAVRYLELDAATPTIKLQLAVSCQYFGPLTMLFTQQLTSAKWWNGFPNSSLISRGVTSCAGMTAQHVLLAQTKIGFLTGGRGNNFQELSDTEKQSQREEAFARATVALTRAQRFCFIMCPLDMKGLIGAATVVGCLQHGAGVCEQQPNGSPLLIALRAESLAVSRSDEDFLGALQLSAARKTGEFPPAALVEIYQEPGAETARLRRLHLIIVDLCHPRKVVTKSEKYLYHHMLTARDTWAIGTTPIPLRQTEPWRCRYSFGYGTEHNGFGLIDVLPVSKTWGLNISMLLSALVAPETFDARRL